MKKVYLLHHVYEYDDEEEIKIIGVYETKKAAEKAIEQLKPVDSFKEYPSGFHIDSYHLNKTLWTYGFSTCNYERSEPDPEMSEEEKILVGKLNENDLCLIDKALMSNVIDHWRKVAGVVGTAMSEMDNRIEGIPDLFYAERIRKLVKDGYIESRGNLQYMRFSEIRTLNYHQKN